MTLNPVRVLELRSVRGTGGGPEKTILLGTAATDPRRYAITVCYIRDDRDDVFAIGEWARSVNVDYVELRERHSFDPSIWTRLREIVRERQIDIIHSHDYKTNLLAWCSSLADGTIPLSTVHGWTGHSRRERHLYYPADKRVLARFPKLIAVSSEIRRELVRCGAAPDRVEVVLNGIDDSKFARDLSRLSAIRSQFQIGQDEIVVGAVGRLEPQKRFDVLMQAVAAVRVKRPNVRLIIAGDGSSRAALEATVEGLNLRSACRLLGHCTDVSALHHAFDIFVQSSDYEGTPNSVLEAMALRTPIVATDVGGTSELVTPELHGLIVPPSDPVALAAAIERTIQDPNAARARADAARQRIETELSFLRRMERIETAYDDLMKNARASESRTARRAPECA